MEQNLEPKTPAKMPSTSVTTDKDNGNDDDGDGDDDDGNGDDDDEGDGDDVDGVRTHTANSVAVAGNTRAMLCSNGVGRQQPCSAALSFLTSEFLVTAIISHRNS